MIDLKGKRILVAGGTGNVGRYLVKAQLAAVGAAQSMMARVLMKERADLRVRINEIIIYSSFGRGNDEMNDVKGEDIGRYVSYLLHDSGAEVKGQIIHLRSQQDLAPAAI